MASGRAGSGLLPHKSYLGNGRMNPEYSRLYYQANREKIRAQQKANRKPHAHRINNLDYRRMLISLLRHRDQETCGICGEYVEVGDESVDHILPRSNGGSHEHTNIRLAHRRCNHTRPRSLKWLTG